MDASLRLAAPGGRFVEIGKTDVRDPEAVAREHGIAYQAIDLARDTLRERSGVALTVACLGVVGVIWVAFGYSLAFGPDKAGLIGSLAVGLHNLSGQLTGPAGHRIPVFALASFQLMFAIITVALLAGAVAERTRFWPWLVFVALWVTIVYLPLAHWVFDPNGWFVAKLHLDDFAGGTAVGVDSGAASLALAVVVGKRVGWPRDQARPHNLPMVMLGGHPLVRLVRVRPRPFRLQPHRDPARPRPDGLPWNRPSRIGRPRSH